MPQPIKRFLPFGLQGKSGDPIGRGGSEINFHFGAECPLHRLAFDIIIVHNKNCRSAVMLSRLIHACKVTFSVNSQLAGTRWEVTKRRLAGTAPNYSVPWPGR